MSELSANKVRDLNAPTFEEMCALFYTFARNKEVWDDRYDDTISQSYRSAVVKKTERNQSKGKKKGSFLRIRSLSLPKYDNIEYDNIEYIDYAWASEQLLGTIGLQSVFDVAFERIDRIEEARYYGPPMSKRDRGWETWNSAAQALEIAGKLSGAGEHAERDIKNVRFDSVSKDDYSASEVSQLLQCWITGMCENVREQLDIIDAARHARQEGSKIAAQVSGQGRQDATLPVGIESSVLGAAGALEAPGGEVR